MTGKMISVPIEYYQLLAVQGRQYLDWLAARPAAERLPEEDALFVAYIKWYQWHEAAEERGLTR